MEAPFKGKGPVGELKKIVSLVDRTDFDDFVYPSAGENTLFQAPVKPYHNFIQESVVWTFEGGPSWGQRITFSVPWPWQGDFLNWIALRLKPSTWLPPNAYNHLGPDYLDWVPTAPNDFWIWANSLGTAAIAQAEMEVDGVTIEQFSGDWMNVWNKAVHTASNGAPYDDTLYASYAQQTVQNFRVSDDGYVYCYLPFAFSKFVNTAWPLLSCSGPNTIRFHITLRPFNEVVRKLNAPVACDETLLSKSFQVRDYTFPFLKFDTVTNTNAVPGFEAIDFLCGISSIDGELREAYIQKPHEILYNPVVETVFNEPLKYLVNTTGDNTIKIQLPLTQANGPIRQMYFFLRRKVNVEAWRDYNNYSATIAAEASPTWNPYRPLLIRAQLQAGTAVWADEEERWWRAAGDILLPGGVRAYGNYIYAYNFAEKPTGFDPSGSLNASRVDLRLLLTVEPPGGAGDIEWSVHVFFVGTNWMRFQNGLANQVFMD
jgi:hypothetical protein